MKNNLKNINEIAKKINIPSENLELYGKYKAKIDLSILNMTNKGKVILVTAINPTPMGEGKTTISIGLSDALNKLNKKAIVTLREPSLGPVFGLKGGATGGGLVQVAPMNDINLHFTGDIHAITCANNLISSIIDNHIYQGNLLKIKKIIWNRCLDINDRSLRNIELKTNNNDTIRIDHFDISVASEIMAILCLSENLKDLKKRLSQIIIGYNENDQEILVKDLKIEGALTAILKDALKPNLVQTLENNPAIIHGGPFANIAHGCNSLIATQMGIKLADYCITEAGFGADLGAEKFLDIKTRYLQTPPSVVVIVATIKALKYHGGMDICKIKQENIDYLQKGLKNLIQHVSNLENVYNLNVVVALNKFESDTIKEINYVEEELKKLNIELSIVDYFNKGSEGGLELAQKVVELTEKPIKFNYCYELDDSISLKIEKISKKIYHAQNVIYSKEAKIKLKKIEKSKYNNYPICIAKTPYSFSDDPHNLLCENNYDIHVTDIIVKAGAKFIVVMTGNIYTMPGLPKKPAAENIDVLNDEIIGIL